MRTLEITVDGPCVLIVSASGTVDVTRLEGIDAGLLLGLRDLTPEEESGKAESGEKVSDVSWMILPRTEIETRKQEV